MSDTADFLAEEDGDEAGEALSESQILNIVGQELQQASGGNENDFIDANRQNALSYYLGSANGKEVEGKSTIISTDVADAIEWVMPAIMKQFTANNEVVHFDPVFEGDEHQADLESQYTYDILMKQNPGFVIIHQLVKDCLMQKNGIIKSYFEEEEISEVQDWTGIGPMGYQTLVQEEGVEILEETQHPPEAEGQEPTFDVRIRKTYIKKNIAVMSVPPEEFRISRQHNSIVLDDARFLAHVLLRSRSELVKDGYDEELIYSLSSGEVHDDDRDYRFYMQGETVYPDRDVSNDRSQEMIEVSECFIFIDMDNTGVAERYKIIVAGGDNPDNLLGYEKIDSQPFSGGTAILMSHKFFGLSLYDRLRQIQDQKTTLWRNIFDNLYLQNNQRNVVLEGQVNLDDLLVSRPGGIIRAKSPGAVTPLVTPMLGQEAYQMMDYLDQVRAGRAGVSPEGSIQVENIGDRVGSEGIQKLLSAKEELVGLMIRVIAETAIKPLCYRIRDLAIMHNDVIEEYKFRGFWTQQNPSEWINRTNSTVRVGTGTGNKQEMVQALQAIIGMQERISGDESQYIVDQKQVFNAVNDFAKAAGLMGAREYFIDPESPEGQEIKKSKDESDQKMQEEMKAKDDAMMEMQVKLAEAEMGKAKAQLATAAAKAEESAAKMALEQQKQKQSLQIEAMKAKLEQYKLLALRNQDDKEMAYKYEQLAQSTALELTRIESQEGIAEQNANMAANKESVSSEAA